MANEKVRNSNIELLRILSMLAIVFHHYILYGDFAFAAVDINKILADILLSGGKLGLNIFILITGYFAVRSGFKWKKAIRIWFMVLCWSVIGMMTGLFLGRIYPSLFSGLEAIPQARGVFKAFMPISFNAYWFATDYIVLYLLSPFLTQFVENAGERQSRKLVCLLLIIWCVVPMFLINREGWAYSDLGWFILMYLTGAYLSLYGEKISRTKSRYFRWGILMVFCTWIWAILLNVTGARIPSLLRFSTYFMNMTSIFMYLGAVFLFLGFKNTDLFPDQNSKRKNIGRKTVNLIASAAFGVYLFHENEYIRPILWKLIFQNSEYGQGSCFRFLGHAFYAAAAVYGAGTLLELLRQYLVEKPVMKLADKVSSYAEKKHGFGKNQ